MKEAEAIKETMQMMTFDMMFKEKGFENGLNEIMDIVSGDEAKKVALELTEDELRAKLFIVGGKLNKICRITAVYPKKENKDEVLPAIAKKLHEIADELDNI